MTRWEQIARSLSGADYAHTYAERFRELAARGEDVHGEANFVTGLLPAPARVLDAGCGTGRVAIRLAELGYDVVGIDIDVTMLREAREEAPHLDWRLGDLALLDTGEAFDVVLAVGNTIPLLEPGTLHATAEHLAAQIKPGGLLVCGFGLDDDHLPGDCPVTPLSAVETAFADAGLAPVDRFSSWERESFEDAAGYVVTVDRSAT
ncbi:class I SAM-dependent methyltransferase [Nocardioides sp.]|uniref:class I SAM-dependent methyltransferase n=1 Tax=Nocardioides sp. TaxID=35761 RepID=UPI00356AB56B